MSDLKCAHQWAVSAECILCEQVKALTWTTAKPTVPGQYKIRPLPNEKVMVGSEEITDEKVVTIDFVRHARWRGLCIFLNLSTIDVAGPGLEFMGPLEPPV